MRRLMALSVILGILSLLSACNTVKGVGKDVEKAGEAIQKSTR